jgi:hypothetical protein
VHRWTSSENVNCLCSAGVRSRIPAGWAVAHFLLTRLFLSLNILSSCTRSRNCCCLIQCWTNDSRSTCIALLRLSSSAAYLKRKSSLSHVALTRTMSTWSSVETTHPPYAYRILSNTKPSLSVVLPLYQPLTSVAIRR